MTDKPVRVLVAEDSSTVRAQLIDIINRDKGLTEVGEARDGNEALALVEDLLPDVESMDIKKPVLDGLSATRIIMEEQPTPVVVVSGYLQDEIDLSFLALEAGALAVVPKPPAARDPAHHEHQLRLTRTLIAMAQVRLVKRRFASKPRPPKRTGSLRPRAELIGIGASAGGPSALATILNNLPPTFPAPICVVQHIPEEFVVGMVRWLQLSTALPVRLATDGQALQPGVVHLAPGNAHLMVRREGETLHARLVAERGIARHQPSVDILFESMAMACGNASVGIVLTGMGDDGAAGLLTLRHSGARTIAQDRDSSVVFGMPGAAIAREAAEHIVPLRQIAAMLQVMV